MFKKKFGFFMLVAVLMFALGGPTVWANDTSKNPQNWDVHVSMNKSKEVSIFSMQPGTLIIHEGDTVKFSNDGGGAPHTVTFWGQMTPPKPDQLDDSYLQPNLPSGSSWDGKSMLNSGMMMPGQSYKATFTSSGVFPYLCLLHPSMVGTIIVVPKGQPIPSKEQQLIDLKAQLKAFDQQASDLIKKRETLNYVKNKNGTVTYTAYAGSGTKELMINRYSPNTFYINEGDTIKWITDSHDFQFVTFNLPKGFVPISAKGDLNPVLQAPKGGPVFNGKGVVSSGPLMGNMSFKLTFAKAGTYTFKDPLWGKTGKVIVAPKGAAKLVVNNTPVVTSVVVKQGQTFVPASVLPKITSKKLVVGKTVVKYTFNKKVYVSLAEVVNAVGGSYSWDATLKLAVVKSK